MRFRALNATVLLVVVTLLETVGYANVLVRRKRAETSWSIGVLVIVDFALWHKWRSITDTDAVATENIEFYFTHLISKVNKYYSGISEFDIEVVLQQIRIAKTPEGAPWTETLKAPPLKKGSANLVDANAALIALSDWLETRSTTFGSYDHVMVFTGYDLFTPRPNNQKDRTRVGTARVGGLCSSASKISFVEDRRDFRSVLVAAHELAHNVGAKHDTTQNSCSSHDEAGRPFVMAAFVEAAPTGIERSTKFSTCSASEINTFFDRLSREDRNCANVQAQVFDGAKSRRFLKEQPGQRFSLTDQCTRWLDAPARFCGYPARVDEVCVNLICVRDGEPITECSSVKIAALDGTTCGNKKWCIAGSCVYNSAAPEAEENCVTGDFIWPITNLNITRCDGPETRPHCYQRSISALCCATCKSHYDASKPGCEYGDKAKFCGQLRRFDCYKNEEACCETCRKLRDPDKDCRYGDRVPWCNKDTHCSTSEFLTHCCGTCRGVGTSGSNTFNNSQSRRLIILCLHALLTIALVIRNS